VKSLYEARADFTRGYLAEALARSGNHPGAAARLLKISRSHFYRLLEKCHLVVPGRRKPGERNRGNDAWRSLSH
jgi:DNA-binding NtrC family response regulator